MAAARLCVSLPTLRPYPTGDNRRHHRHHDHHQVMCSSNTSSSNGDVTAEVKVDVGPVGKLTQRAFPIKRKLGPRSTIAVVTLPKPLGIVFTQSKTGTGRRVLVEGLVPNGHADRASRVTKLFDAKRGLQQSGEGRVIYGGSVKAGDLLRATTSVNVVVDLFGLRAPQRVIVLFVADNRTWAESMGAIQSSFVADGPVTLILERES